MCKFCSSLKDNIPLNIFYKDDIFSLVRIDNSVPILVLNEHRNFLFEKEDDRLKNLIKLWFIVGPINIHINNTSEEEHWHCYIQLENDQC